MDAPYPHIEAAPGVVGGRPRIAGRRIAVADIAVAVWHEHLRLSADDISVEYDLSLAQIYAALEYYFDRREGVDRSIWESEAFAATVRESTRSLVAETPRGRGGQ